MIGLVGIDATGSKREVPIPYKVFLVSPNFSTLEKPFFATIQEAIDEAEAGQTIHVMPGTYSEKIILKDDVNLVFEPNCSITNSTLSSGPALITGDDVTCNISGRPNLIGSNLEGSVPSISLVDCRIRFELGHVTGLISLDEDDDELIRSYHIDLLSCDNVGISGLYTSEAYFKAIHAKVFAITATLLGHGNLKSVFEVDHSERWDLNLGGCYVAIHAKTIINGSSSIPTIKVQGTSGASLAVYGAYIQDSGTTSRAILYENFTALALVNCRVLCDTRPVFFIGGSIVNPLFLDNCTFKTGATLMAEVIAPGYSIQCKGVATNKDVHALLNVLGQPLYINSQIDVIA
jgi:hypothetical protein